MPIYEYQCDDCSYRSEELQKMGARPLRKCPSCGGKYRKQVSAPAFQFKGTGWYVTDYARKDKPGAKGEGSESSSKSDSSAGEGKKTESKSESASKKKNEPSPKKSN
jgi:putative FmdB family regulatory protein